MLVGNHPPCTVQDSNATYSTMRMFASWWLKPGGPAGDFEDPQLAGFAGRYGCCVHWRHVGGRRSPARQTIARSRLTAPTAGGALRGIVSSGNPHDASSAHSNVALRLEGERCDRCWTVSLRSRSCRGWMGCDSIHSRRAAGCIAATPASCPARREQHRRRRRQPRGNRHRGAIREQLVKKLASTSAGDAIDMAMFYLSERHGDRGAARRRAPRRACSPAAGSQQGCLRLREIRHSEPSGGSGAAVSQ